jgi:hypothetical protein
MGYVIYIVYFILSFIGGIFGAIVYDYFHKKGE